jgi:hypothetical protein
MASVAVSRRVGKVVGYPPPARRLVEVMDVFAGRDAAEAGRGVQRGPAGPARGAPAAWALGGEWERWLTSSGSGCSSIPDSDRLPLRPRDWLSSRRQLGAPTSAL